ncbi:hypothetical protein [Brucella pituitosa]
MNTELNEVLKLAGGRLAAPLRHSPCNISSIPHAKWGSSSSITPAFFLSQQEAGRETAPQEAPFPRNEGFQGWKLGRRNKAADNAVRGKTDQD